MCVRQRERDGSTVSFFHVRGAGSSQGATAVPAAGHEGGEGGGGGGYVEY